MKGFGWKTPNAFVPFTHFEGGGGYSLLPFTRSRQSISRGPVSRDLSPGRKFLALYINREEPNETQCKPIGYPDPKNLALYSN